MLKRILWSIGVVGLVAALGQPALAEMSAFLWSPNGGLEEIGPDTCARAINNRGELCGETWSGSAAMTRAFRWSRRSGIEELPVIAGFDGSICFGINDRGDAIGSAFSDPGMGSFRVTAVRWTGRGVVDLGASQFNSSALDLNARGDVVGWQELAGGERRAFLWDARGRGTDLGTLGGSHSVATAINNRGEVVGYSELADLSVHAFIWTHDTGMLDLGTVGGLNSRAFDINEWGGVVGSSDTAGGASHAFIWMRGVGFYDLGSSGVSSAFGVNARGQIVGVVGTSDQRDASVWFGRRNRPLLLPSDAIESVAWATNAWGAVTGFLER